MADIIKRGGNNVIPADFAAKLVSGIAESRASTVIAGGGKDMLRMLKSGEWVYGVANTDVQDGSRWALNPLSIAHGFCCWVEGEGNQKNELKGEIMVSIADPKPIRPPPIEDNPYTEQRSFELLCLNGDDEGVEVLYKNGSVGGMRAVDGLLVQIQKQLSSDPGHPCPVLELGTDSYPHSKWGKIYVPVFSVVGWCDMSGVMAGETPTPPAQDAPQAAVEPPAAGKGRRAAAAPVTPAAAPEPTVQAQAARGGQRRRPAVR